MNPTQIFCVMEKSYEVGDAFDYDVLTRLATNYYINKQSWKSSEAQVSGRGAATAATVSSTDQCRGCKAYGHFQRDCSAGARKSRYKKGKKGTGNKGGGTLPKWCSLHKPNRQSEAGCHKQIKEIELKDLAANLALLAPSDQARVANIGSAYLPQPPQPEPTTVGFSFSEMGASLTEVAASCSTSMGSDTKPAAPAPASSETPKQDHRFSYGGFGAFMATSADLVDADLRSDGSFIRLLVDSGASDNYVDPYLTPALQSSMGDCKLLPVPHTIVATGQNLLEGVVTGTLHGTVTDEGGHKQPISFHAVVVPGLGKNLFSVTTAMTKGIAALCRPANPRLEKGGIVLPMQQLSTDEAAGRVLCSITAEAGNRSCGSALKVESNELWHRRIGLGHINRKSLDVLMKLPAMVLSTAGTWRHAVFVLLARVSNELIPSKRCTTYITPSS